MSNPITGEALHLAQWQHRLQDAIDQSLSPAEMLQLKGHLASCTICKAAHSRLMAVDLRLRTELSALGAPSPQFDAKLFANIAALEKDQLAVARLQEQQEHAARMTQWRNSWRELARFHLGSMIGTIVTVGAVATAVVSAWPSFTSTVSKDLTNAQQLSWLPQGAFSMLPATAVASVIIAVAAIWITRRLDNRTG